jgi:glycosyltransferase involved in cell wall biosynthesis
MRVLHVISTDQRRGAEMFASHLIELLKESEISQRVVVLNGSHDLPLEFDSPTDTWNTQGRRIPGLRIGARSLRTLRSLISDWTPDLIQAHGGEALKYVLFAGLGRRQRVIYRKIGAIAPWAAGGPRRIAYSKLMRRADRIVTTAEALREEAISLFGVAPNKVVTIPRGVDTRRVQPDKGRKETRRLLGISEQAKVILSLGALTWEKDPIAHIRITAEAMRRQPDVVHIIAGTGPMLGEVEEAVRTEGLRDRVLLLGIRSDVGDLLAASDLMLLASRTEGMPGCVIEAGMAGLAVAAYNVGGVSEVIEDGVTGLLAEAGDESALLGLVVELLEDDSKRSEFATAAQGRCLDLFDSRQVAGKYVQLYSEMLSA